VQVRVLFTSTGGDGHVLPLLPLAGAFAARGDEVAFAAAANHRERIEGLGLRFEPAGPTLMELEPELAAHRAMLEQMDGASVRPFAFSGRFAEIEAPYRLPDLRDLVEASSPDVVIHESADLAAPIAAAAAGVPTVNHAFGLPIPEPALLRAGTAMAPSWQAAGLEPDELAGAYRNSFVGICPPSFGGDLPRTPSQTYVLRPAEARPSDEALRDRPFVYATLGTSFNAVETFRLLLDAFETVDCDVLMTVGRDRDPRELEPIPVNVAVERYIPQADLLPRSDAVVAHAGSGSVFAALAHGLPLVLVPQGADQFANAAVCTKLGVAETILPAELEADAVRGALERILGDASYATRARSVATEIAVMPSAAVVADQIAAQRWPK
jgi:UDP:flavonoid glycosyltransferase YjiC (YdhE family)